jgi:tRNA/rRNA methyltransferase
MTKTITSESAAASAPDAGPHPRAPGSDPAASAVEDDLFTRVRFIMVNPSHPGNVGAAARAIKTMGFHELTLVAPRFADVLEQPEAVSLASGATDVLQAVQIVPTLRDALAPVTLAFALTARARVLGPPACDIRVAANLSREHLGQQMHAKVAIVLGTERSGLTNEDIALCQRICHIPANPNWQPGSCATPWPMRQACR